MSGEATSSMEVDTPKSVLVSSGSSPSVTVSLHPLVILNISEHFTRVRAQEGKPSNVFGAILGKMTGRHVEICNSFEVVYETNDGETVIDKTYLFQKEEQFKQVFSDLDRLGWYTTGGLPSPADLKVHRQFCDNESPIMLKLNPLIKPSSEHLPVTIYESVIDITHGELFSEVGYTLATEEAERIGIDHVARSSVTSDMSDQTSTVSQHLLAQYNAIKMLHSRIKLIVEYLKAIENKELPVDQDILREAAGLCHMLPAVNKDLFDTEFFQQCNDVSLISLLGSMTKGCNTLNQYVNKFNVLYDRQSSGRRPRGLFL